MCGRFALKTPAVKLREMLHFDNTPTSTPRYNIAPSQEVFVIRLEEGRRIAVPMRWGLIPSWAKDPAIGNRMINARCETIAEKPAFRESFRLRRCLIPADGFYEWQARKGKGKQPFYIHQTEGDVLTMTGIWDRWVSPAGEEVLSCAIITTAAGPTVGQIHTRMPVIIPPQDRERWLSDKTPKEVLLALLQPPAEEILTTYAVDSAVNKPEVDNPSCIVPAEFKLS